jgi:integrase/recombinase XerD
MKDATSFPTLLETFFTRRLIAQRRVSPNTITSYRDTFRLLFLFAQKQLGKAPSKLIMEDLNAPFLGAFLDDLERTRSNGPQTRNLRLTAIRSFFRYAALETPQYSGLIQRVLVIPNKRQTRPLVGFLTRLEMDALLAAPDRSRWIYLDANLRMKEEVLSKVAPIKTKLGRYQPDDDLLAFLKSL